MSGSYLNTFVGLKVKFGLFKGPIRILLFIMVKSNLTIKEDTLKHGLR